MCYTVWNIYLLPGYFLDGEEKKKKEIDYSEWRSKRDGDKDGSPSGTTSGASGGVEATWGRDNSVSRPTSDLYSVCRRVYYPATPVLLFGSRETSCPLFLCDSSPNSSFLFQFRRLCTYSTTSKYIVFSNRYTSVQTNDTIHQEFSYIREFSLLEPFSRNFKIYMCIFRYGKKVSGKKIFGKKVAWKNQSPDKKSPGKRVGVEISKDQM